MGRRALITGATGFVGGHLASRLVRAGWQVRALVRATSDTRILRELGVELSAGGLEAGPVRRAAEGVDVVFHLAALTAARSEREFERVNTGGTRAVVDGMLAAQQPPGRIVYLSSYAACGPSNGRPRFADDPPNPLTAYGRTKLAGEAIVSDAEARGLESVTIRAPAVYGPRDTALLPYFRLVGWGLAPAPGGADRRLHLIYAPDLAEALLGAAAAPPGVYAVAEPVEHSWDDLVSAIGEELGRRPLRIRLPEALVRASAAVSQSIAGLAGAAVMFNREKAEEMLAPGWVCELSGLDAILPRSARTSLANGIAETVRWYRRQGWL